MGVLRGTARPSRQAELGRAGPGRAAPGRAKSSRVWPSQAGWAQGWAPTLRPGPCCALNRPAGHRAKSP